MMAKFDIPVKNDIKRKKSTPKSVITALLQIVIYKTTTTTTPLFKEILTSLTHSLYIPVSPSYACGRLTTKPCQYIKVPPHLFRNTTFFFLSFPCIEQNIHLLDSACASEEAPQDSIQSDLFDQFPTTGHAVCKDNAAILYTVDRFRSD